MAAVVLSLWLGGGTAEAAIIRGLQEVIGGILSVPVSTLDGTFHGPPILGTLIGAVNGLIGGVGLVAHGELELGISAVSVAKTVAPFILPFLF